MNSAKKRNRGASLVEMTLLIAFVAIVTLTSVKRLGKNAKCPAYLAACGASMRPVLGVYECNPGPFYLYDPNPNNLLTAAKWYCENSAVW